MADRKISELNNITGANLADDDEFALVDTSADETKAITFGEFKTALDTATGFVRITGDTMTGNLTVPNVVVSGNVDGRDVSADGTKLDGIEAGADVTDATNVTAAGALMDSELANLAAVKAINQGLSTSDSPSFDAVTVGGTGDPSSEMTILSSIGGTSELRLGDTDADAGSIKYFNSNDQLVLRAAAATRAVFSSTGVGITGKTTTDELDLNAIAATISDTAVDISVYDTRKDSDGGAWRKRTQHTSWYNEAASSTRGSRKEFPAVAVIVATSSGVTIYDGDDPDMPMWMVFAKANPIFGRSTAFGGISCCSMMNGTLALGNPSSSAEGLLKVNFISDNGFLYPISSYSSYGGAYTSDIASRASSYDYGTSGATVIVSSPVNDVAMTVLPNAPIDAATGLPVPTIAVATDGGVSVIKDDGTVVDITTTSGASGWGKSNFVAFRSDNKIVSTVGYSSSDTSDRYVHINTIPSADFSLGNGLDSVPSDGYHGATGGETAIVSVFGEGSGRDITSMTAEHFGQAAGLSQVAYAPIDTAPDLTSMVAYTTSDYATGWMNGDIKLATLSDTDDTDVTGSNLIVNGDFSSNSDWVLTSIYSIGSGVLTSQSSSSGVLRPSVNVVPVVGKTYVLTFDITAHSAGTIYVNFGHIWVASGYHAAGVGSKSFTFTPTSTAENFSFYTAAFGGSIDNVVLREAEPDRSVNGNGLQVFGTVTKNPVATGADLVSYGGWSASNYLYQPYNADLNFGTGEYSVVFWFKQTSGSWSYVCARGTADNAESMRIGMAANNIYFDYGSGNAYLQTNKAFPQNVWHCCVATVKAGEKGHLYLNGVEQSYLHQNVALTSFLTATDYDLVIGQSHDALYPFLGELALLRVSGTVPSPEQIKKIYEDEKHLFQTGAQATLYGSSDAVTALAYDDSTELLHVGTSAGRSVFQGLRRVDNTTTAVGAAISASNGLVADE